MFLEYQLAAALGSLALARSVCLVLPGSACGSRCATCASFLNEKHVNLPIRYFLVPVRFSFVPSACSPCSRNGSALKLRYSHMLYMVAVSACTLAFSFPFVARWCACLILALVVAHGARQAPNLASFATPPKHCARFCHPVPVRWMHGWVPFAVLTSRPRTPSRAHRSCSFLEHCLAAVNCMDFLDFLPRASFSHFGASNHGFQPGCSYESTCVDLLDLPHSTSVDVDLLDFPQGAGVGYLDMHPIPFLFDALTLHTRPVACPALKYVPGFRLVPVENFAASHCWWLASSDVVGHSPESLMAAVADSRILPPAVLQHVFAPITSTEKIALLVSILHHLYPTGLLICHQPALTFFLFLPSPRLSNSPKVYSDCTFTFLGLAPSPLLLSFAQTAAWLRTFPDTPVMLFSQEESAVSGHFVGCRLFSNTSERNNEGDASMHEQPQYPAMMCGSGIFSDPLTSDASSPHNSSHEGSSMEEVSIPASQPRDEDVFTPCPHARVQSHFSSSASQAHVTGKTAPGTPSLGEVSSERNIAVSPMIPAQTILDSSQKTEQSALSEDKVSDMSQSQHSPVPRLPASWQSHLFLLMMLLKRCPPTDRLDAAALDYAVCLCGGAEYMRGRPAHLLAEGRCQPTMHVLMHRGTVRSPPL